LQHQFIPLHHKGCTQTQADTILGLRPFESLDDLNNKLGQGGRKSGPAGISSRMFEECQRIFEEYGAVDSILEDCEQIGTSLRAAIASWATDPIKNRGAPMELSLPEADTEDGALNMTSLTVAKDQKPSDYLVKQPSLLSASVQLKEYQLLGVNWLNLLYRRNLSCILADEMGMSPIYSGNNIQSSFHPVGLGKTVQVIAFLAHLKENGAKGPHLIIVP